ncbi:MAG: hypothetical protein GY862_20180 [Gammaproteobacteria bacterium]|nr:hypothetical protein [Gammaproteobacteria bacterium]
MRVSESRYSSCYSSKNKRRQRDWMRYFAVLGIAAVLSACTGSVRHKFAGQGCLGGALIGAAGGAAVKGRQGAVVGAVAGCLAGAFVGFYFARRKEEYADQQEAVLKETAWNKETVRKVQRSNRQLAKNILAYEKQIKRIQTMKMNQKQRQNILRENKRNFQEQFEEARRILEQLQIELAESDKRYEQHKAGGDPSELQKWRGKIDELEKEKTLLKANIEMLNAMNTSLGII